MVWEGGSALAMAKQPVLQVGGRATSSSQASSSRDYLKGPLAVGLEYAPGSPLQPGMLQVLAPVRKWMMQESVAEASTRLAGHTG